MTVKRMIIKEWSVILLAALFFASCKKDWLDAKPQQSQVVPATLKDFQSLLDNTGVMNQSGPNLCENSCDNYLISDDYYGGRAPYIQGVYRWAPGNIFAGAGNIPDWTNAYQQIYYANTVLEGIEKVEVTPLGTDAWKNIKGSALFYRAFSYHNLAKEFCAAYDKVTAKDNLGLILRTTSDINAPSVRATVKETYDLIISDLMASLELLPITPLYKTRPSKPAAFAMLARAYNDMEIYDSALVYSKLCLDMNSASLMDYNNSSFIDPASASNTIKFNNPEVIFENRMPLSTSFAITVGNGYIDPQLYSLYSTNDKRRDIFFKTHTSGRLIFVGNYSGNASFFFDGLAVDEVYLIRAECEARRDSVKTAMQYLNALLIKRWKTGQFLPESASSSGEALAKILNERRKELVYRGIRWSDLRRINKDARFAITLKRIIAGQTYTLPPNDNRYILPIPDNEVLYSDVQQNAR